MKGLSWSRIAIIARREYLSVVRRRAFLFTAIGTPLYFALVMWLAIRPQMADREKALRELRVLAVVDSSGLMASGSNELSATRSDPNPFGGKKPPMKFQAEVRRFPDFATAEDSLRAGSVSQVLVIPPDYLETGRMRRYARSGNVFTSADRTPLSRWIARAMLSGRADSLRIERAARPLAGEQLYRLSRSGDFELNDDMRELFDFLLPFSFGMLLGLCIVIGGQYLLQGISEEKESRILESLLCTVSSEDLLAGKLIGLGGAGLTLVAFWIAAGASFGSPAIAMLHGRLTLGLLPIGLAFLLLGYLFYGSLMTGIGAMASNVREAQQFAFMFTFANWVPFLMMQIIIGHPNGGVATGLSLFPPTAPVAMMMRFVSPDSAVPTWQVALSMLLMLGCAALALWASARVFRIGLLMYGKTPSLPEIARWIRAR
jgi:ABC-2 type transport system permease protein